MGATKMQIPAVAGLAFFSFTTAITVRLAWAEAVALEDSAPSLRLAVALETRGIGGVDVRRLERLAELDPSSARADFAAALAANPRSSSAWIATGLDLEQAGDTSAAEQALLEATRIDRRFLPAWTAANFYFRRRHEPAFWRWARRTAELTYDDLRPLLKLSDAFEPDPRRVVERLGDGKPIARAYLDYLIGQNRLPEAGCVAQRLLAPPFADEARLANLTGRHLQAGDAGAALKLWNGFAGPLDPVHGPVLTNGELRSAPSGEAFDWTVSPAPGISPKWLPGEIAFHFSGAGTESATLLEQTIPNGQSGYRLRFEYQTSGISTRFGARWALNQRESPPLAPSPGWSAGHFDFRTRASGLARLQLLYRRDPGTTRPEGTLRMRHLTLDIDP